MNRLLKDDDGYPTRCDYVFATVVSDVLGSAAALYWARCAAVYGHPLTLLDWDVAELRPATWAAVTSKVAALRARCGQRAVPVYTAWVEGVALTEQAKARGCAAKPVFDHLTAPDAWPALCQVAAQYRDSGAVMITKDAAAKIATRKEGFAGLPRLMPGPRGDDPTVPAWLYGIALALDPASARQPQPAKVKVVTA